MPHRILLVDDERPLLTLLKKFLERREHEVELCETGQAAIDLCTEAPERFEVVVLDLGLPDLPGEEVLARLLAVSPSLRVLISSGSAWHGSHLSEADQRRTGSILKPFMPQALVEAIGALLVNPETLPDAP